MLEIVAMDAGVNLGGRLLLNPADYEVTSVWIRRNLRGPWVVDDDPFQINQFGHPYQGAMYHGIARSNGLGYWSSVGYTFAGSALWEIAGETTPPSVNDQIASGIAGSFNLRLIAGRRAALDVTAREYFVTSVGGFGTGQRDLIAVGDASLAVRVYQRHALGLTYRFAGRSSNYPSLPDQTLARSRVGAFYTFLGSGGFGAVR